MDDDSLQERDDREENDSRTFNGMEMKFTSKRHFDESIYGVPYAPLPLTGKFLEALDVFRILNNPSKIIARVPKGHKSNMFFLVDNSENQSGEKGVRGKFDKEDGTWDSGRYTYSISYFIFKEGKPVMLKVVDNQYYVKNMFLVPQPDASNTVKLMRHYYYSKEEPKYRRRISVASGMSYDESVALYEYCGPKANKEDHNQKRKLDQDEDAPSKKVPKLPRQTPTKEKNNTGMLKDTSPGQVRDTSSTRVPEKTQRENLSRIVSDEKWRLMKMLAEDRNIQAVISRKESRPCVVLYNKEQLGEMIRNLECENLIGLDCSRRIGDCHVTTTVYQNSRALHKTTYEPLLFFGPMYLHWDDEFMTYVHFFSHLIPALKEMNPNFEVRLGDRADESLFRALKHSFPSSECIVNYHRLKGTVAHEVTRESSGRKKCNDVLNMMFGPCGLTSSPSAQVYERRLATLKPYLDVLPRGFRDYFEKLEPLLYPYVCEPQRNGLVPKLWQEGNDEYVEVNIARALQSIPGNLLRVLERLSELIKSQMVIFESS